MNYKKIQVTEGPTLRDGTRTVVGAITVHALAEKGKVPIHRSENNEGYQRPLNEKRVAVIAKKIEDDLVDLPTAILISIRDDADKVLTKEENCLTLDLSSVEEFYIVDGQHRHEALIKLWKDENIPPLYKIPFVGMIGASETKEMEEFYVVNSTSNKVDTSLAYKLLENLADIDDAVMKDLIETGTEWKVKGQKLLTALHTNSNIWKGKIQLAGDKKGKTIISSTSMIASFEKIFKGSPFFDAIDIPRQAKILDAYWKGIAKVTPDAFSNLNKYSIQKGVGVRVIHGIFPDVLERAKMSGSVFLPDNYADIMKQPLEQLSGDDGHGGTVMGHNFWLTGKDGAPANYSSAVGMRTLTDRFRKLLPDIKIDDIK